MAALALREAVKTVLSYRNDIGLFFLSKNFGFNLTRNKLSCFRIPQLLYYLVTVVKRRGVTQFWRQSYSSALLCRFSNNLALGSYLKTSEISLDETFIQRKENVKLRPCLVLIRALENKCRVAI